ncbi:MAG: helix-turn-helix domain-containing protein [Pseudoxanthomonas sp.]
MAVEMKVNTKLIKTLREERAWSQEHLATVAGLSARTVQRLEADGNASMESKMAIAAAFGIEPSRLTPEVEPRATAAGPASATGAALLTGRSPLDPIRITWWAMILAKLVIMGVYRIGADLAHRDNRIAERCAANPVACKATDR